MQSERQLEIDGAVQETGNLAIAMRKNAVRTINGLDEIAMFLKLQYEKEGRDLDIPRYVKDGRFKG